jgi:hypothetical protein
VTDSEALNGEGDLGICKDLTMTERLRQEVK